MNACEKLRVKMVVAEECRQTVVRGTVMVPDPKPDVEQILSTDKTAKVKNIKLLPNKAVVDGTLTVQVVYVAKAPDQSVHSMHLQQDFTTFVDLPGAMPGMDVEATVSVEDVSMTPTTSDPRSFDLAAVLEVCAKVSDMEDVEVATRCPSGCRCESEEISLENVVGSNTRQVLISQKFDVPQQKPAVEKILDSDVDVTITATRVLRNKVIFDGQATLQVLYVAFKPDQSVHSMHTTFKFSDFVEVPGAMQGMDVRVDVRVESVDVSPVTGDPERLQVDMVLKVTVTAVEMKKVSVITDVSGCSFRPVFVDFKTDRLVGEGTTQVVISDSFFPPPEKPDVEKILETTVSDIKTDEPKVLPDKVVVSGTVNIQVLYVGMKSDQSVHVVHRKIPFRTFVDVPGAEPGMKADVRPQVEYITARVARDGKITVDAVLKVPVRVSETLDTRVLTCYEQEPEVDCPPGTTINYTVQQGDTFYSIGRKYGVSAQQIIAANPGVNPNNLQPGMTVKVPCPPAKG